MTTAAFSSAHRPVVWNLIEKRGRRPSHTFLDYALSYMVGALLLAFTLGEVSTTFGTAVSRILVSVVGTTSVPSGRFRGAHAS